MVTIHAIPVRNRFRTLIKTSRTIVNSVPLSRVFSQESIAQNMAVSEFGQASQRPRVAGGENHAPATLFDCANRRQGGRGASAIWSKQFVLLGGPAAPTTAFARRGRPRYGARGPPQMAPNRRCAQVAGNQRCRFDCLPS